MGQYAVNRITDQKKESPNNRSPDKISSHKPPLTNLIKELNLLPLREQRGRDRVHGRVAPSLVVEPAALVEVVEEGGVRGPAPELEVGDLEVGPD